MKARIKAALKRATAGVLFYSGLLWVYAAIRLRHRAVVLMYHRVLPSDSSSFSHEGIVVQPQTFERHMSFLMRFFCPMSVDQLAAHLESRTRLPTMSCVVTFDDGWVDNFEHALPLLERVRVPVTVFLAADYIGSNDRFWQERLAHQMFRAAKHDGLAGGAVQRHISRPIPSMDTSELRLAVRNAIAELKEQPLAEIEAFESELNRLLPDEPDLSIGVDRFMSWEQAAQLTKQSETSFGAHGCSHTPLTRLATQRLAHELRECRCRIAAAFGKPVVAVAYPNGDFNDAVVQEARLAGFRLGFTTRRGHVSATDDPFRLRRINIHESATATLPEFLCTLLGVFRKYQPADDHAHSRNGW